MKTTYGLIRVKKLMIVMAQLRAAPTLGIFAPPMSPPHRCHELAGDRKGQLTMDLDHPYRLYSGLTIIRCHRDLRVVWIGEK